MPSSTQSTIIGPVSEKPFRLICEGNYLILDGIRDISRGVLVGGALTILGGIATVFAGILLNASLFFASYYILFFYNIIFFFYNICSFLYRISSIGCALMIGAARGLGIEV